MATDDDFVRLLAAWALVHETADEGWKAAVERGKGVPAAHMDAGPEAFVDGLSAMVAEEKERLKARLAAGEVTTGDVARDAGESVDELRFEVGELRGRIESLQATLDSISRKLGSEE